MVIKFRFMGKICIFIHLQLNIYKIKTKGVWLLSAVTLNVFSAFL